MGVGKWSKPNDECYTPAETAEYIVNTYSELLQGKKIILPCDCEWSELFKACKAHGLDCETAQDMYNVDYSRYDICFTNPPFHTVAKYIRGLNEHNVKFLLFTPWITGLRLAIANQCFYVENFDSSRGEYCEFYQPDGSKIRVHWALVSNIPDVRKGVESKPPLRIEPGADWTHYRGIFADFIRCNYLPYDGQFHAALQEDRLKVRRKFMTE